MADPHDAQDYTANGPTDIGFRTGGDGTGIDNGVVSSGKGYGVHGTGLGPVGGGIPETVGVFGESKVGNGVKGLFSGTGGGFAGVEGISSGPGVRGVGSPGVVGEGTIGVKGVGTSDEAGDYVGVRGEGSNGGAGVLGEGETGVGVDGHSISGPGVRGRSVARYGGVFGGNFAQLRLEPAELDFGPPRDPAHKAGEFFVDHRGVLFYCYGGSPPSWQRLAGGSLLSEFFNGVIVSVLGIFRGPGEP